VPIVEQSWRLKAADPPQAGRTPKRAGATGVSDSGYKSKELASYLASSCFNIFLTF
jgi:hypothetical protein